MSLPAILAPSCATAWQRIRDQLKPQSLAELEAFLAQAEHHEAFNKLLATSDFFLEQFLRHHTWFIDQLANHELLEVPVVTADLMQEELSMVLSDHSGEPEVMAGLRRFRNQQMLRIVAREFLAIAELDETFRALTALAEVSIRHAVVWATSHWQARYGIPKGEWSGEPQELVVLGMGKLGGGELNLSSDIDLIFLYPESGATEGQRKSVSNQEFFIRVGQTVIKLLDSQTVDGFCFRVDMRLRPFGGSGALVANYSAMELYLQEHGREWERYAMVKARPVTGTVKSTAPLEQLLGAFVYRRYTDFGVIESLRTLKQTIEAETRRLQLQHNIKRGAGGIREVEFIVQCKQLIHGGRHDALRVRPLNHALQVLADLDLISRDDRDGLNASYRFLRRLENALQGIADEQTQALPEEDVARARLAWIMGAANWVQLHGEIDMARAKISRYFSELINLGESEDKTSRPIPKWEELSSLTLSERGFAAPEGTWEALESLMSSIKVVTLQKNGRDRLEQFLPHLIEAASHLECPDLGVLRTLPFVTAVLRRSAYLSLMNENPAALAQLAWLNAGSLWISKKLEQRPELVEELLHEERLFSAPSREEMAALVREQLLRVPEDDLEQQMQLMATIKDGVVLRVAASELSGRLDIMKASDNLTFLAEVIIQQAIDVARAELVSRHGVPGGENPGFAVMGYGKLGGIELGYGSDLDLVFVYSGAEGETSGPRQIDNARFFARLAQRVVHILGTNVASGQLYEVDMRLRPNGQSGLPCVNLEGFLRYQAESAWTWEHQALVRARPVAGDPELCAALKEVRRSVLCQPRDDQQLLADVISMRRKMWTEGETQLADRPGQFDIKRAPGGIIDIEFMVQYLVLREAPHHSSLPEDTDVVNLLGSLATHGILTTAQGETLRVAYLDYRAHVHRAVLEGVEPLGHAEEFQETLTTVIEIRNAILPGLSGSPERAGGNIEEK